MDVFKDSDPLGGNWKKQEIVTAKLSKMFKFDEIEGLIFQFRLFLKCKYLVFISKRFPIPYQTLNEIPHF